MDVERLATAEAELLALAAAIDSLTLHYAEAATKYAECAALVDFDPALRGKYRREADAAMLAHTAVENAAGEERRP